MRDTLNEDLILNDLKLNEYFKKPRELEDIKEKARRALIKMINEPLDYRGHLEAARDFLRVLWTKYDCENVIKVFEAYTNVEPVLNEIVRDVWYRDHSVHTFHVFIFGLRLINKIINEVGDAQARQLFKIEHEDIKQFIPEFNNYNYKERLVYLWALISTFHDIAIPFEHLDIIQNGLSNFFKQFDIKINGPVLEKDFSCEDLNGYFELLSRIYQGKATLDDSGICYDKSKDNIFIKRLLGREFSNNNHGVLSGFLMYKTIEKTFLLGQSKHAFEKVETFNSYEEYILNQDVARAALAISLHNLKKLSSKPSILPFKFDEYPLTYMLILSDGIQEYLRWGGSLILEEGIFNKIPELNIKFQKESNKIQIEVIYSLDEKQKDIFIKQSCFAAKTLGCPEPTDINDAANVLCKSVEVDLKKQIEIGNFISLVLTVQLENENITCSVR